MGAQPLVMLLLAGVLASACGRATPDGATARAAPATPAAPTGAAARADAAFDDAFVSITDLDSTIVVDARYYGSDNFLGRPVAGYDAPKCLLTREAAGALAAAQAELREFGLGLKVYDCYRPQRAVDDFVAWARVADDTAMKAIYYPSVDKADLFSDGYIAERSGHSRGSTVDLTLVPLAEQQQLSYRGGQPPASCRLPAIQRSADGSLDMGTSFDCFDPLSHTANTAVGAEAARNRLLLRAVMRAHGFSNYPKEWWHFTLQDEPFPDTYFDRPVR
jgi:zinc D-Ala-D-Ala dipeptidase